MTPDPLTLSTLITLHFSLFTPHFSDPSPEFVSSHLLTNKFYPLPQGARGLFYVTNFSYIQLFNPLHSSPFTLHSSPFTPHSDKNLSPYRLAVLSPSSTLLTLHSSRLTFTALTSFIPLCTIFNFCCIINLLELQNI